MNDEIRARIASATVRVIEKCGQGVLVPGGFVLTATHCITWSGDGGMVLGDYFVEKVKTAGGANLRMQVLCAEPVSDIAVLGAPDDQTFPEESLAVESFVDSTLPVNISMEEHGFDEWFPVSILSHRGNWVSAKAAAFFAEPPATSLSVKADADIFGGTSGGPIVNDNGELVGVVSNFGGAIAPGNTFEDFGGKEGTTPRPHLTLPVWVWQKIARAMKRGENADRP